MSGTGIAVIVVSFNRPRLLREALRSIRSADQIIVADDGSDFDVRAVIGDDIELVANPPILPIDRLRLPRVGALLNRALRAVREPLVTYLNDDDLFAPDWVSSVADFFTTHPSQHICRGDWLAMEDRRNLFGPSSVWCVTTGNYAYRTACAVGEGCWWSESTIGAHDAEMLLNYILRHGMALGGWSIPHINVVAGLRRDHVSNMADRVGEGTRYKPGAEEMFALGARE